MLDLSIVIVSFNTRDLLLQCLRSVVGGVNLETQAVASSHESDSPSEEPLGVVDERSAVGDERLPAAKECLAVATEHLTASGGPLSAEIWVVDNSSTDGSTRAVAADFPDVRLISNERNRGFAAACNQAIRQCNGRYVLLLNPDTVLLGDALQELVNFADRHPRVGIVGGQLVYPDGSFQHSAFRFPTLPMAFLDFFPINHRLINSRLNGRYPASAYGQPFPVDHPLGAAMLVRKDVFDQIGFLDEDFFIYCEEIDLCIRARRAGWDIYCVPSARIVHYSAQSTRQVRARMLVELYRSRYRLFRKHYGGAYNHLVRAIIRLGVLGEVVGGLLRVFRKEVTFEQLKEMSSAYWAIFRM